MRTKIIVLATALITSLTVSAAPPAEEGKTLFTARCAACHNVTKQLVGPALAGVDQRRSIEWIVKFVQSSQTVVKSGDQYAVDLFNKFKVVMPDHPDLTADNIKSIVEYIKAEGNTTKTTTPVEQPKKAWYEKIEWTPGLIVTFAALIALLILSLVFLAKVKALQRQNTKQA
jgi:cytochrome c551/c552